MAIDEISIDASDTTMMGGTESHSAYEPATEDQLCAFVSVLSGRSMGAFFKLARTHTTLGRSKECDICLGDHGVSRQHARLLHRPGERDFVLQDLNSTNGTFVGGERVATVRLGDGDRFRLGTSVLLKVMLADETEGELQCRIYESSVRDGLTGIYNRRHFDERLTSEISFAVRRGSQLALIMLDLDFFKKLNDTYGHQAGDAVLKAVAETIQAAVRAEDIVARYGGEELCVLARGIALRQAITLAERLRQRVEALAIPFDGRHLRVTVSAGVAAGTPADLGGPEDLLAAADRALYLAKRNGRNRVEIELESADGSGL